jgi:drug/metabolite transporter (DMT)-like permease
MLWGSLYGVSQAVGVYWFYAAVSAGPISVVSPLAAVLNAAVPVAVGVALGERPGQTAAAGVVLAMFAVILVSRESPADEDVRTHRFTSKVAWLECRLWLLFFARAAATVLVFAAAAMSKNLQLPSKTPLRLAVAAALLDTCANITMLLAIQKWMLSLASILISLYPATTVILAIIVLRERVTRWQALGMILAAVSVSMIAAT